MRQGKEMDTKFVTFAIISSLLVAAIYSSSIFFVSAALNTICTGTSPTTTTCVVQDGRKFTTWECKTKDGGKTWSCKQVKAMTGGSIPPALTDSLTVAIENKVPNNFLNKGGLLTEDNQITTNKESSPTPPPCPNTGPIPPDCTMKPLLK